MLELVLAHVVLICGLLMGLEAELSLLGLLVLILKIHTLGGHLGRMPVLQGKLLLVVLMALLLCESGLSFSFSLHLANLLWR